MKTTLLLVSTLIAIASIAFAEDITTKSYEEKSSKGTRQFTDYFRDGKLILKVMSAPDEAKSKGKSQIIASYAFCPDFAKQPIAFILNDGSRILKSASLPELPSNLQVFWLDRNSDGHTSILQVIATKNGKQELIEAFAVDSKSDLTPMPIEQLLKARTEFLNDVRG